MANEFLRQTTDAKLDSRGNVGAALRSDIKQYRAEARFLRALSYWHGIDMFGDIPLITEADLIGVVPQPSTRDRKSTRLNSSHRCISYAVFCLKKKKRNLV